MKTILAAAALALLATSAHAGPELPDKFFGHWCYNEDASAYQRGACQKDWLDVNPTGFSISDWGDRGREYTMHCTLLKITLESNRKYGTPGSQHRTTFKCNSGDKPQRYQLNLHGNNLTLGEW